MIVLQIPIQYPVKKNTCFAHYRLAKKKKKTHILKDVEGLFDYVIRRF